MKNLIKTIGHFFGKLFKKIFTPDIVLSSDDEINYQSVLDKKKIKIIDGECVYEKKKFGRFVVKDVNYYPQEGSLKIICKPRMFWRPKITWKSKTIWELGFKYDNLEFAFILNRPWTFYPEKNEINGHVTVEKDTKRLMTNYCQFKIFPS